MSAKNNPIFFVLIYAKVIYTKHTTKQALKIFLLSTMPPALHKSSQSQSGMTGITQQRKKTTTCFQYKLMIENKSTKKVEKEHQKLENEAAS